jgi:hypothetical protein
MAQSASLSARLLLLSDQEFEVAKSRQAGALRLTVLAGLASIVALLTAHATSYVAATIALLCSAAAFGSRQAATGAQGRALRALRRCQLAWAYDLPAPADAGELMAGFSRRARSLAEKRRPTEPGDYWASGTIEPGDARLAATIDEGAFWTRALFRDAARRSLRLAGGSLALLVAVALIGIPTSSDERDLTTSKVVVVLLGVLLSTGEFARAFSWRDSLAAFGPTTGDGETVLLRFSDYHVAVAGAPPVPTALYKRRKDELQRLWSEHQQQRKVD